MACGFVLQSANDTTVEILSHWHPNLTINLVEDFTPWQQGGVPAPLDECKLLAGKYVFSPIP